MHPSGQPVQFHMKRVIDVLGALLLLFCFGPLIMLIALALRLRNGALVLYRETRCGRYGQPFTLLKFRTLGVATGFTSSIAAEGDARIVPMGQFLRRWRLDELPQLVNVLVGDMSLVGPRPLPEAHARALSADVMQQLLAMAPGLTGPASIRFVAEDAVLRARPDAEQLYLETILPAKALLELEYLKHWSLGVDLKILLQTPLWVWSPRERRRSFRRVEDLLAAD